MALYMVQGGGRIELKLQLSEDEVLTLHYILKFADDGGWSPRYQKVLDKVRGYIEQCKEVEE